MELILIIASLASLAAVAGILYPFKPFGKRRNALFTLIACFVVVGVAAPPPESDARNDKYAVTPSQGEPLAIPSDPRANYYVTAMAKRTDGMIEVSTRREGPSGNSFAIRLIQCEPLRFGYISEGDTEADLVRDPSPKLTDLLIGSISDVVAKHACARDNDPQHTITTPELIETEHNADDEKRTRLEDNVREFVETLLWSKARNRYRTLSASNLATDVFKDEIEARMLELVRPLPASERDANLKGYQFLAAVRPDKTQYSTKIQSYEEAINTARQRAVAILRQDEDRVEGITWYKHPNQPRYVNSRSTAYLYIGRKGAAGRPWLRMKVQYTSSDWLFVKRVIAWHDGIKEPLISGYFERDNNSNIWEWMDVSPNDSQIEMLRSLGNANEAILRFEGDQYRKDVKLSAGDKRAIREVLEAYKVMRSGL